MVDEAERILLVKRGAPPRKGFWCLPGGFMELEESPEETALRELREEAGITGRIDALLGVVSQRSRHYGGVLIVGFLVKSHTGELRAGDDAADAAFFAPDALPELAFESHRRFIRIYRAAYAGTPPDYPDPPAPPAADH